MKLLFLGCAGGRRITFKQQRASGGFLVFNESVLIHVDPGPGAFIRLIQAGIDPAKIDAFILSHKHLDHSADINTLIEAKTMGGWSPGGILAAPRDALEGEDPVVMRYHRDNLAGIYTIDESFEIRLGSITVKSALKHQHHGVETYGLIFSSEGTSVGYVTDGKYCPEMGRAYKGCDVLIISTTFRNPRELDHLCLDEAVEILSGARPKLGVTTHVGAEIVFWGLDRAATYVEEKSGIRTIAAKEFTVLDVQTLSTSKVKLKNPTGIAYRVDSLSSCKKALT